MPTPTLAETQPEATMPPNQDSWILVDLPPDATQLQHGAEIYRLVCSACHALTFVKKVTFCTGVSESGRGHI